MAVRRHASRLLARRRRPDGHVDRLHGSNTRPRPVPGRRPWPPSTAATTTGKNSAIARRATPHPSSSNPRRWAREHRRMPARRRPARLHVPVPVRLDSRVEGLQLHLRSNRPRPRAAHGSRGRMTPAPGECAPCPLDAHSFVFTYVDNAGRRRACLHYRNEPGRPQCDGSGMPIPASTTTVRRTQTPAHERPGHAGDVAPNIEETYT